MVTLHVVCTGDCSKVSLSTCPAAALRGTPLAALWNVHGTTPDKGCRQAVPCRCASPLQRVYDNDDPGPSQVGMVVPLMHTRPTGEKGGKASVQTNCSRYVCRA